MVILVAVLIFMAAGANTADLVEFGFEMNPCIVYSRILYLYSFNWKYTTIQKQNIFPNFIAYFFFFPYKFLFDNFECNHKNIFSSSNLSLIGTGLNPFEKLSYLFFIFLLLEY
jgi:hypothetical protein